MYDKDKKDEEKVEVSIICNTYNHEEYIEGTLKSFIKQKTSFKFEILIHDDASTDNTASIIKKFEKNYPDIIYPIYQIENQYSKGINITITYQYPRVKGKYIAVCEGDDFWIDEFKLQKQYELMEKHLEIDMSAHEVVAIKDNLEVFRLSPSNEECIFSTEEVISGGGAFVSTNSLFYRKRMIEKIPEFYMYLGLDYTLQIWGSLRGGMLYIPNCMAAYRVATPGSWTVRVSHNKKASLEAKIKSIKALRILDDETNKKYSKTINAKIDSIEFDMFIITGDISSLKKKKYAYLYNRLSIKQRLRLYAKYIYFFILKK